MYSIEPITESNLSFLLVVNILVEYSFGQVTLIKFNIVYNLYIMYLISWLKY